MSAYLRTGHISASRKTRQQVGPEKFFKHYVLLFMRDV